MIRSFFNVARKGLYVPTYKYQASPLIHFSRASFATAQELDKYTELRHLSKILGTTYFKHNNEIDVIGDVRLVDSANRLIGIYSITEAKKKCEALNSDMVLINANAKPAICKAMDYREDLYKRFVKEILEKDLPKLNKQRQKIGAQKSLKLGAKMTIADLKTKSVLAQEMAKRAKAVRVYMPVTEDNEEGGRNIIFTFGDIAKDFLKPKGEIQERVAEDEDEVEEGDEDKKTLSQEFTSLLYNGEPSLKAFSEDEVRDMVKNYIKRETKKSSIGEDIDMMIKQRDPDIEEIKSIYAPADEPESGDLDREIDNVDLKTSAGSDADFNETMTMLMNEAKNSGLDTEKIQEEIEQLRLKYAGDRNEALYEHLLSRERRKIDTYTTLFKIRKLMSKRKSI